MSAPENHTTLLGASTGPLELRVVGSPLAGQTVRLNAAKCTIGSSRRCTLRLQARRVEPVHCLILRGEHGTIIRRWSPQTRLNGAAFTDALLQPGDRLTIGPVELDVVSTGQFATPGTPAAAATPSERMPTVDASTQPAALVDTAQALEALQQREASLAMREEQLATQMEEVATQKQAWEKSQAAHQAELSARQAEQNELQHELNNLRQLQLDLPELLEDRDQYDARRKQLAAGEAELVTARAALETRRIAQEATLAARLHELEEQSASNERVRRQLAEERASLEKQQQAAVAAFAEQESDLQRRQHELTDRQSEFEKTTTTHAQDQQEREQAWQEAQAAWAVERQEWNKACQETSEELQRQQAELERTRRALATDEVHAVQADTPVAETAVETLSEIASSEIASSEAASSETVLVGAELHENEPTELENEPLHASEVPAAASLANAFATDSADNEEACDDDAIEDEASTGELMDAASLHLHDEADEHEPSLAERLLRSLLPGQSKSPEEQHDLQEHDLPEQEVAEHNVAEHDVPAELDEELPAEHLDDPSAGHTDESAAADTQQPELATEDEPLAFEEPVKASPAESSGLMDRLRAMTEWEDDEHSAGHSGTAQPAAGRPAYEPMIPLSASAKPVSNAYESSSRPALAAAGGDSDGDEESIEDYMAKLLSRVRGDAAPPAPIRVTPRPMPQPERAPAAASDRAGTPSSNHHHQGTPNDHEDHEDHEGTPSLPEKPFEMSPRIRPPELSSNLAAMRELANFSARDAIDTSVRNRWSQAAIGKFSVAVIAILSAGILLVWSRDPFSLTFLGAGVAMLVAVFWGLQGIIIARNVQRANQVLATQVKDPVVEAAELREMLYADADTTAADADVQEINCETLVAPAAVESVCEA